MGDFIKGSDGKFQGSRPSSPKRVTPASLPSFTPSDEQKNAQSRNESLSARVTIPVTEELTADCARRIAARMVDIQAALDEGTMVDDYDSGIRGRYVGDVAEKAVTQWINKYLRQRGLEPVAYSNSDHGRDDVTIPGLDEFSFDTKTREFQLTLIRDKGTHVLSNKVEGAIRAYDRGARETIYIQTGYTYEPSKPGDVEYSLGIDRKVTGVEFYGWAYLFDYERYGETVHTSSGENTELPWQHLRTTDEFIVDLLRDLGKK